MDLRKLWSFKRTPTVESTVEEARTILKRGRPAEALEYLRDSGFAHTPDALVFARQIVHERADVPPVLLRQPFLDPIWSQCRACDLLWVEPLNHGPNPLQGVECDRCGRVYCTRCINAFERPVCPCGGRVHQIAAVRGRVRTDADSMAYDDGEPEWPTEPVTENEQEAALFFGVQDRIPVAVDPNLKSVATAGAGDRLRWTEVLIDQALYYHAAQLLEGVGGAEAQSPTAKWLRARLLIIKLAHARERSRQVIGAGLARFIEETPPRIATLLEEAVQQDASAGDVWLTAAEYYLDVADPPDFVRAAACAERARALLGDRDRILLAVGRASEKQEATDMERRALRSPPDPISAWRVGRGLISSREFDRARRIFEHLVAERSDRPEGHCGLGQITFLRSEQLPTRARLTRAHELCTTALNCSPEFAPAHELMGTLLQAAGWSGIALSSRWTAIGHFERALELDADSDVALAALADESIERRGAQRALELLERAAATATSIDEVYFKLAAFYQAMRQPERQREAYRRAKALAPHKELAVDARNKIFQICGFEY